MERSWKLALLHLWGVCPWRPPVAPGPPTTVTEMPLRLALLMRWLTQPFLRGSHEGCSEHSSHPGDARGR